LLHRVTSCCQYLTQLIPFPVKLSLTRKNLCTKSIERLSSVVLLSCRTPRNHTNNISFIVHNRTTAISMRNIGS